MAYLLCFDFDGTLVNGHWHNYLANEIPPGQATTEHVQKLVTKYGLKNPGQIRDLIRTALQAGNYVAVVSYTHYPEIIKPTLREIGLSEDEVEQIFVRGGFPSDNNPSSPLGKKEHLEDAQNFFAGKDSGIKNNDQVVLIEDSVRNYRKALDDKYRAVFVPKEDDEPIFNSRLGLILPPYINGIYTHIDQLTPKTPNPLTQTIRCREDWKALMGYDAFTNDSSQDLQEPNIPVASSSNVFSLDSLFTPAVPLIWDRSSNNSCSIDSLRSSGIWDFSRFDRDIENILKDSGSSDELKNSGERRTTIVRSG